MSKSLTNLQNKTKEEKLTTIAKKRGIFTIDLRNYISKLLVYYNNDTVLELNYIYV